MQLILKKIMAGPTKRGIIYQNIFFDFETPPISLSQAI